MPNTMKGYPLAQYYECEGQCSYTADRIVETSAPYGAEFDWQSNDLLMNCPQCNEVNIWEEGDGGQNCWECGDPEDGSMGFDMCNSCKVSVCDDCIAYPKHECGNSRTI